MENVEDLMDNNRRHFEDGDWDEIILDDNSEFMVDVIGGFTITTEEMQAAYPFYESLSSSKKLERVLMYTKSKRFKKKYLEFSIAQID